MDRNWFMDVSLSFADAAEPVNGRTLDHETHSRHGAAHQPGPEANFTGLVWMQNQASGVVRVTFAPGARTAWHTHPQGQTLLILSGTGLVQKRGEAAIPFAAGDVVIIEAGEEHWHGAAPDSLMVHLALQSGETVWLAKVTEEEYGGK